MNARWFVVLVLFVACPVLAQTSRLGRLSPEEQEALRPGLQLAIESLTNPPSRDVRTSRLAALYVPANEPPTPFVPAGRFRAVWTGYLKAKLRGEFQFHCVGKGAAKLLLNGEPILAFGPGDWTASPPVTATLVKGFNRLRIEYESPPAGDSQLRLYWAGEEFSTEPVPPTVFSFDGRDESWRNADARRHGRELVAGHHCLGCHAPPAGVALTMPELTGDAPRLHDVGSRLETAWLANWILDPAALRNRTTMPKLPVAAAEAADIAAYLTSLTRPASLTPEPTDEPTAERGARLFENLGCLACHRLTPPIDSEDKHQRLSLYFVGKKFRPGVLAEFLRDPHRDYAWSRMPKFPLTAEEATAIAAYLRSASTGRIDPVLPRAAASASRGQQSFVARGCSHCHSTTENAAKPAAIAGPLRPPSHPDRGCLAAADDRTPRFPFDDRERQSLVALLQSDLRSLSRDEASEFAERQMRSIGCTACHSRDGVEAVLPGVQVEEGNLGLPPDPIPGLTWAGEKLLPAWSEPMFAGKLPYRTRPHFRARMPAFPVRAKRLAIGLSHQHGFAPTEDSRPKFDPQLAKTGEAVAAMETGLACHRCHAIGDREATAPFEARSTNFSLVSQRLRYDFYQRWMTDPLRVDPVTRMIKFAQDGRKTGLTAIYDGDAKRQFEAMWHYLESLGAAEGK